MAISRDDWLRIVLAIGIALACFNLWRVADSILAFHDLGDPAEVVSMSRMEGASLKRIQQQCPQVAELYTSCQSTQDSMGQTMSVYRRMLLRELWIQCGISAASALLMCFALVLHRRTTHPARQSGP